MKKIVIAAGTGFLGSVLINYFKNRTEEIIILTRRKNTAKGNIRYVTWDAKTLTGWERELENADVLINLAGKSINCRYTEVNKNEIMASRIDSTAILNQAVIQCINPPKHWLNSSTATIYKHSLYKPNDEVTGEKGYDFSMKVARAWEKVFFKTETPLTKKTALRTSIVLGKNGGAYPMLKRLVKFGLGGQQGFGRQAISWIHEEDFARAIDFIIQHEITGEVNVVSPMPIQNKDFMKALQKRHNMCFGLSISEGFLKIGAAIIGTETELVLKSRNVIPKRLQDDGFKFKYNTLEEALNNL